MFYALLIFLAGAVAALDQWTKALALERLSAQSEVLIPGWLELEYLTNDGMALSMLRGGRWVFIAVTAVFLAFVVWVVVKKHLKKKPELILLSLITGGAIGNLIDRIAAGKVIDMICVPWFSTFNVADIFITVGAVLLVLYILIFDREFLSDKKEKDHDDPC